MIFLYSFDIFIVLAYYTPFCFCHLEIVKLLFVRIHIFKILESFIVIQKKPVFLLPQTPMPLYCEP